MTSTPSKYTRLFSCLRLSHSHTHLPKHPFVSPQSQQARALSTTSTHFANTHSKTNSPPLATPNQQIINMRPTPQDMLIRFYDPAIKGTDEKGRTLEQILAWDDATLERTHDYIQTLFPLPEPSGARYNAPLVTLEVRQAFKDRPELRETLLDAFNRMLTFFGLEYNKIQDTDDSRDYNPDNDCTHCISDGPNWETARLRWVVRKNHNHLRITRILRSLRVLGCPEQAQALHSFIVEDDEVTHTVSQDTQGFWTRAAKNDLWLPPNELDQTAVGTEWLNPAIKGRDPGAPDNGNQFDHSD
jgi:hypothetical protein